MIHLRYSGWFQCRLATDPDPYDELRGVSGYVHAYAGEPDLNRIITFQDPPFVRTHGVDVGVRVDGVVHDDHPLDGHSLVGARVNLLGEPKYEGRNGVVADDGLEPVYPFEMEVATGGFRLRRSVVPQNPDYPYPELFSRAFDQNPDAMASVTGIHDLTEVWRHRRGLLDNEARTAQEPQKTAIAERIEFLDDNLGRESGGAAAMFGIRMHYRYTLSSPIALDDPDGWLPEAAEVTQPWAVDFWFGGWDADLLCGFTQGVIHLGADAPLPPPTNRGPAAAIQRRP